MFTTLAVLFAGLQVQGRPLLGPAPAQPPAAAEPGIYAVVEGMTDRPRAGFQSLTVTCPAGMKATGAGFSAVIRQQSPQPGAPPPLEAGVRDVRAFPDGAGSGWRVEGFLAGPENQPWKLAVRVACLRVG